MRLLSAALRALPVTFAVYAVEALLALFLVQPLARELARDSRASLLGNVGQAVWLEQLLALQPALRVQLYTAGLLALLVVLLSPWLQMAWLRALSTLSGLAGALGHGVRLYPRAVGTSLATGLVALLGAAPCALLLLLVDGALTDVRDARLADLALLLSTLPLLWVLFTAHVLHDLARARALHQGAWSAVRGSLRAALAWRSQLTALGMSLAALLVRLCALWWSSSSPHRDLMSTTLLLQGSALAAVGLRSLWLAYALACAERGGTSPQLDE